MNNICGIIVEYNPLHNGHIYHINKAKELTNSNVTIAVMSGNFTQRGEPAIVDKFIRTKEALKQGIDLVIELPFLFATQSADYFSHGALSILNQLGCTHLVFGSEDENFHANLLRIKNIVYHQEQIDARIKKSMELGNNYPEAYQQALHNLGFPTVNTPNNLLGFSYMKEIILNDYPITPISIRRTHPYHNQHLHNNIASASGIRHALRSHKDVTSYTPMSADLNYNLHYLEDYFDLLKYKLLTTSNEKLANIHLVDEGIENKMLKEIVLATSMESFISSLSSKRYTKARIQRTILYILLDITKQEVASIQHPSYIRVLGMNETGKAHLHNLKGHTSIPIITRFSQIKDSLLDIEFKATCLYASTLKEPEKTNKIQEEYIQPVIIKK